jgi:hypothetical protein
LGSTRIRDVSLAALKKALKFTIHTHSRIPSSAVRFNYLPISNKRVIDVFRV